MPTQDMIKLAYTQRIELPNLGSGKHYALAHVYRVRLDYDLPNIYIMELCVGGGKGVPGFADAEPIPDCDSLRDAQHFADQALAQIAVDLVQQDAGA
jgi:hypothetical protein